MSTYQIYFSPTGHTKEIVKTVSEVFGNICEIDLSKKTISNRKDFSENDVCAIGVPSYGGRVPAVALERMSEYRGNGAKAIIIVSYGNRDYDDTLKELQDFVNEKGFSCIAAVSAIAEHSIMHQFATGRPDEEDKKELVFYAKRIVEKLTTMKENVPLKIKGNVPYKEYNGIPLKPQTDDSCKGCGICASSCPVGAIPTENPKTTDINKCISCMRCIQLCPSNARKMDENIIQAFSVKMEKECSQRKNNELFF